MLKTIRNLKLGWIIILTGIIIIASGLSMTEGKAVRQTFICFDNACIYIQGISSIAIGLLCFGVGIYMILKK